MDTIIGKVVDNYKIIEVIGRGGMGVVFKAMDLNLEKTVALKMIDPFLARDENFLKRFKTEAKALAKLDNRNIVNVYALRETELGLFMVMEYVQAKTISEWLREKGKFSINETLDITRQILNAIGHAHKIGVIHRDIKPNNILLCENGDVKVMDFGLAKVAQEHGSQSTVTYAAAGTLYYMPPEQIKGLKNVDYRSDIYSIGMTIYEMLAGRTPFEKSESEFAIQKQIVDGKIPSPIKYNPAIPKDFENFIMKVIDKNADNRFQTISEMNDTLAHVEYHLPDDKTRVIITQRTNSKEQVTNGIKNKKLLVAVMLLLIGSVLVFGYFIITNNEDTIANDSTKNTAKENLSNNKIEVAKLTVESNPQDATVMIDGKVSGKTPLQLDSLEIRNYSIVLSLDGYEQWSNQNYRIFPGNNSITENLKLIPAAANATLNLSMDVAGNIYIDGKKNSVEANQVLSKNVAAGTRSIKFVNQNNVAKVMPVDLKERQNKKITCYFQHQLNIQSLDESEESFWGSIYLDNNNTGTSTPNNILLGPGKHSITVKRSGYKTIENEVVLDIKPGFEFKTHSLVFHLKRE